MATPSEALASRFQHDIFQHGRLDVADELVTPTFVWHGSHLPPELPVGPAGVRHIATLYRTAFPDLQITQEDVIASGDKVVIRWRMRGTQGGEFLDLPPSGKPIDVIGIDIFRIADGKLAELWQTMDDLGLEEQIDAIPTLEEALGYPL